MIPHPTSSPRPAAATSPAPVGGAALLIALAVLAVYSNSLHGASVYDDVPAIVENPTIRHLWPPADALSPPRDSGLSVAGRPAVNFSFALNRAGAARRSPATTRPTSRSISPPRWRCSAACDDQNAP